jgi:hypothetical protein
MLVPTEHATCFGSAAAHPQGSARRGGDLAKPAGYLGTGDASAIIRANPLGAIFSHCQPTVRSTGSLIDGVEHVSTTSRPMDSAVPVVGEHVHSRPPVSVTVRLATLPLS